MLRAIVRSSPCLISCGPHSATMAAKALRNFGPVRSGALVGVVLAGGEGRRMGPGAPKPLRLLAGRPMVAHVVGRLRPQGMDLVVVANDPAVPFLPLDLTVRLCGLMHVPEPDVLMVRHGRRREHTIAVWSVRLAADLRRAVLEGRSEE